MPDILAIATHRRRFLGGLGLGSAIITLPGCTSMGGFGLVDAVQRLLFLSSERAFARMLDNGGFWDEQVASVGLDSLLGARGGVLGNILTSALFKDRLYNAFGDIAYAGAERAAPAVTDAVRVIGIQNAVALVQGGPSAATDYLRSSIGRRLIDVMVPEIGTAMRVAEDPLVGQAIAALTGVDVPQVADRIATGIDNTIWREIALEKSAIRRDPAATRDPLIIGVFGAGGGY